MAFINSCLCPWVCIYDFNFTTNDKEILGGNRSGESLAINYLKEFIFEFNAIDLGFSGIKRRLDKGIASISWHLAFPSAAMAHLGALKSNHTPILLDTNPKDSIAHRPFRFKAAWIRDSGCNSIMEKAWNVQARGPAFFKLLKKQTNTRDALQKWNKEVFGHCQARINLLMEKITEVQRKPPLEHNGKIEEELHLELSEWLFRSEIMWKQKSHELWLKEGDRNTKFFYFSAIISRRRNHIDAIKSEEGQWVTSST
ncbi:uncharacterized protein LOC136065133 [Quercus suber]|uniref:uncharacterized protein LOC136065133 n=1 Tax=Quercus suber TaxID=58331 RepID=UPI0032DF153F